MEGMEEVSAHPLVEVGERPAAMGDQVEMALWASEVPRPLAVGPAALVVSWGLREQPGPHLAVAVAEPRNGSCLVRPPVATALQAVSSYPITPRVRA